MLFRSKKCAQPNSGPWRDHYNEMAKKTLLRRAQKYWAKDPNTALAAAVSLEEHHDRGEAVDLETGVIINAIFEEPEDTQYMHVVSVIDRAVNEQELEKVLPAIAQLSLTDQQLEILRERYKNKRRSLRVLGARGTQKDTNAQLMEYMQSITEGEHS